MKFKPIMLILSALAMLSLALPTALADNCNCEDPPPVMVVEMQTTQTCAVVSDTDCVDLFLCEEGAATYATRIAGLESLEECELIRRGAPRPDTPIKPPNPTPTPTPTTTPAPTPTATPVAILVDCTQVICFTG